MDAATMNGLITMLNQLEAHRLEVMLVPLNPRMRNWNEYGMKRVCSDVPPAWYRAMCREHLSSRGVRRGKPDTRIKRANVLSALNRLVSGAGYAGKYRDELLGIASAEISKPASKLTLANPAPARHG